MQSERDNATNRLTGLLAENAQIKSNSNENELLQLRGEVTRLNQLANESANLKMKIQQLEGLWYNVTNPPPVPMAYFPRGKWHVTGNGDPDEIFFSAATAASQGDETKLSALISDTNALSLFSKKRWEDVLGIQVVSTDYINNNGKETAIENTIVTRRVDKGEQIDPNQPPSLTETMQSFPEMHRWYFSKTEGGWKITGGD